MGQILPAPISSKYVTREGKWDLRVGTAEMQGYRINMEDCISVKLGLSERYPRHSFVGVFDGHAGTEASKFLERTLAARVSDLEDPTDQKALRECVMAVDAEFLRTSSAEVKEHGSTCVFSVFWPNHSVDEKDESKKSWSVVAGNVGDSRVSIIRKDGTCVSLTKDHKPQDPREEARIQAAGGCVVQNRVDSQLAMSRAIGDFQYKANPQLRVEDQKVLPIPEFQTSTIYPGDRLFVCCDGIVEQMENEDAAQCIHEEMAKVSDEKKCDPASIIPAVFALSLQRGSKDNMSGALVFFGVNGSGEGYTAEDEYVPGPFNTYAHEEVFRNAYRDDALKHGISNWLELAQAVESPEAPVRSNAPMLQPDQMNQLMRTLLGQQR